MAGFDFVGGAYEAPAYAADAQRCINLFTENNESGSGKSNKSLLFTPGLSLFANLGGPSVPGCIEVNGRAFSISGKNFIEVFADGTQINRGVVAQNDMPPSFAISATQVMIASGGQAYCFTLATNTLTSGTAALAVIAGVLQVGYIDGYFLAFVRNSQQIYVSTILDGTQWSAGTTAIVSVFPGYIRSMICDHGQLCLLGDRQSVTYYDSGNVFPFDVALGSKVEMGSAASFGAVKLDNSYFFWHQSERGARSGQRINGYTPVRVSKHGIENTIAGLPTIADAVSWAYELRGHAFWVTYFPTGNLTVVYDVSTGDWHEWLYFSNGVYSAALPMSHMYAFGKHLVGDRQSGKLYELKEPTLVNGAWTFSDDAGQPIRRERTSPFVADESAYIPFESFELEAEAGVGNQPSGGNPIGPQILTILGTKGGLWNLSINDDGTMKLTKIAVGVAAFIILNDSVLANTSWQVGVDESVVGQEKLIDIPVAYGAQYPVSYPLATSPGNQQSGIYIANRQYTLEAILPVARAPIAILSWSDDRAKTFKGDRQLSLGRIGEYGKRIITKRLGRVWGTMGRVFKLVYTDGIPMRIVNAHVNAGQNYRPTQRLADQLRKGA